MEDLTWDDQQGLYLAVGALVINWGIAESCISQACDIFMVAGGHRSHRLPPKEITRRLKLIKACCKDYPELAHMRDFSRSLISDTKNMIRERDVLIHGALRGVERSKGLVHFVRLDAGERDYAMEGFAFKVTDLAELPGAAVQIGKDWIKFVDGLHSVRDGPNGLKNPDGVRNVSVRERAYRVYQGIKRAICRLLRCER